MSDSMGVGRGRLHSLGDRSDDWYETVLRMAGDGVYQADLSGRFVAINDVVVQATGYDPDELLGEHASMLVDEEGAEAIERGIRALLEGTAEGNVTRTATVITADGERRRVGLRLGLLREGEDVVGTVGVVRDMTGRRERQRERLATLNDVNRVVPDVGHAVVGADSRAEIERAVTERLAAADTFAFALLAEVEPGDDEVRVGTAAGLERPLDLPPDGPVARALATGTVQVVDDALDDAGPLADHAREFGYRSAVSVPVSYEGVRYGVLAVYAPETGVFDEEIERIVTRLGEMVGHAINALHRKRALVGDQVTVLEIRGPATGGDLDGARVELESILPTGDGTYAAYGSTCEAGIETLRALTAELPHWRDLTVRETDGGARYALEVQDPPLGSLTVSLGGRVDRIVLDGDTFLTTVHLPYDVDVRAFVEQVREMYEGADVVAQRSTRRTGESLDGLETVLDERLTDRQRMALEAAYVSGFFEWPRESTGEEVAASMGVSPATFHEHLREAQRRISTDLFESLGR